MIRPRGIGLLLVAVGVFALAGVTRMGWLLLFDAVLWGTLIVSLVMPWLSIGRVRLHARIAGWSGDSPGPTEGEPVDLEVSLQNTGLLPAIFVSLRQSFPRSVVSRDARRMFVAWLGRKRTLTAHMSILFDRRGVHRLAGCRLETSVPFGLFRRSKRIGELSEVLVLPKVIPMGRLALLENVGGETERPLPSRTGGQVIGSRTYKPGDAKRGIHWPNTARLAYPQSKEYENLVQRSLAIAMAIAPEDESGQRVQMLDDAVRVAGSVGQLVHRTGGKVLLSVGGHQEHVPDSHQLLKRLAMLDERDLQGGDPLAGLSADPVSWPAVLAVIAEGDTGTTRSVARLARSHGHVAAVIMRGYGHGDGAAGQAEALGRAGAVVVECRPGGAVEALASLEGRYQAAPAAPGRSATG